MSNVADELWAMTWTRRQIDADAVAGTLARLLRGGPQDFRTLLLVRDTLHALEERWGSGWLRTWAAVNGVADAVAAVQRDAGLDATAFRSMSERLMTPTTIETILAFLRDLGGQLREPTRIVVDGSIALILKEKLSRATEGIDIVDALPVELARSHDLLRELVERHGLLLTHFQSHYLPAGWEARTCSLGGFGRLDVAVLDPYDVLVSKLFCKRTKDFDDLRTSLHRFDLQRVKDRIASSTRGFRSEPRLSDAGEHNWYVLTGASLPPAETA